MKDLSKFWIEIKNLLLEIVKIKTFLDKFILNKSFIDFRFLLLTVIAKIFNY